MPHVDEGTLHALLDGALRAESPERADAVEAHLESCEDCRARLEAAGRDREEAAVILDLAGPEPDAVPDFDAVVARAERGQAADTPAAAGPTGRGAGADTGSPRVGSARRYVWTRRLGWAATVVLALGTGYLIRDLGGPPVASTGTSVREQVSPPAEAATGAGEPAAGEPERDAGAPDRGAGAPDRDAGAPDRRADAAGGRERATAAAGAPEPMPEVAADGAGPESMAEKAAPEAVAAEESVGTQSPGSGRNVVAPQADRLADAPAALRISEVPLQGAPAGRRWSAVTVEGAQSALGGPLYVLPRARLVEVYAAERGAEVLTLQRLESGVQLRVIQRPAPGAGAEAEAGEGAETAGAAMADERPPRADISALYDSADRAGPALPAPETAEVPAGAFLLEITGPLPADLLAILGGAARPAEGGGG